MLLDRMAMYGRLARGLRRFLGDPPLTLAQSREIVRRGLADREGRLLRLVRRAVYGHAASPYRALLEHAGCEYGDLEQMLRSSGVESTLHKLREAGVHLAYEEFKGRKEVVRGGKRFRFRESDFDNPLPASHFEFRTSASRSAGTRVAANLERYRHFAALTRVAYAAHGIESPPVWLWLPTFPSAAWLVTALRWARIGAPPVRWFSPVTPDVARPTRVQRLATRYVLLASRLHGAPFPRPEHLDLERADVLAGQLAETLAEGRGCVVETYPTCAVRVCRAARERGLDLSGAAFGVCGEPLTDAKLREIRASGATAVPMYAASDIGLLGFGCARPAAADDVHLFGSSQVVIRRRRPVPFSGAEVDAFLFTSLLPESAKVLLNVESGDYGAVETRSCGCALEELGLAEHAFHIRGFDKLTGEGMTFVGNDLLRLVEEVLPDRFGGSSADYQIVEEEDERGHSRLTVRVHPGVGAIDADALVRTLLAELRRGRSAGPMMTAMWARAETLRVERAAPRTTAAGKLLPLHIHRSA